MTLMAKWLHDTLDTLKIFPDRAGRVLEMNQRNLGYILPTNQRRDYELADDKLLVDPYRLDENLRVGANYAPPQLPTHFHFPEDEGSFAKTTLRCVGVGECRRIESGTMCPSFMVTREEMHSTRGRARLLFEMLEGDPVTHGCWPDASPVRRALADCR